jgi:hypothetical protein
VGRISAIKATAFDIASLRDREHPQTAPPHIMGFGLFGLRADRGYGSSQKKLKVIPFKVAS